MSECECGCSFSRWNEEIQEFVCAKCGGIQFEDDEDDGWYQEYEDERSTCGCPFCYCSNLTVAGETCNECLAGAHQG